MAKTKKTKLTPKQEQFCREYIIDFNATQAAIRAGYSKKTANRIGPENLSKLVLQERIAVLVKELQEKTGITAEQVVRELAKIGFANIKGVLDDNNEIKDISKLPDDITAAIESIQSDIRHDGGDSDGYTEKVKVKLHSKLHALTDLGKHLGIFEKDNKQKNELLSTVMDRINGSTAGKLPSQDAADSSNTS
jgi:phage terminase small subunit